MITMMINDHDDVHDEDSCEGDDNDDWNDSSDDSDDVDAVWLMDMIRGSIDRW